MVPCALLVCVSLVARAFDGPPQTQRATLESALAEQTREQLEGRRDFEHAEFSRSGNQAMLFTRVGPPGRVTVVVSAVDFEERTDRSIDGLHGMGHGAWSPDDRYFATAERTADGFRAVLVNADTLAWRPVGPRVNGTWRPVWHPDGRTLLLSGASDVPGPPPSRVYVADVNAKGGKLLGPGSTLHCVNPYWQGRWLVSRWTRAQSLDDWLRYPLRHRFYVLDEAGGADEVLPDHFIEGIVVSPDGERAVAMCLPADVTVKALDTTPCTLYLLTGPQDTSPREIGIGEGSLYWRWVRWSHASDRLVAILGDSLSKLTPPWWHDGRSGPLPDGPIWTWPGPGPGGADIPPVAVRSNKWKDPAIVVIDPESGAKTPLRVADQSVLTGIFPTWVDNDSRILYLKVNASGMKEIWSYEFATKHSKRLYPFQEEEP